MGEIDVLRGLEPNGGVRSAPAVALTVEGLPLWELISKHNFPDQPFERLGPTRRIIETAVRIYYMKNAVAGCTNRYSPNFNSRANVADDSCSVPDTYYTFGGIYQNCTPSDSTVAALGLCDDVAQSNPVTGNMSCPSGFTKQQVYTVTHAFPEVTIKEKSLDCWDPVWSGFTVGLKYRRFQYRVVHSHPGLRRLLHDQDIKGRGDVEALHVHGGEGEPEGRRRCRCCAVRWRIRRGGRRE